MGYRTVALFKTKTVTFILSLSDEDYLQVDQAIARVKQKDMNLFNVIKWRFVYRETYRQITQRLGMKSPKVAGRMIEEAIESFSLELRGI